MEENIKSGVLQSMGIVFEKSKNCKLKDAFLKKAEPELKIIAGYFRVTAQQALLIAVLFSLNYIEANVTLLDLITHFNYNPMKLLEYGEHFETLYARGILQQQGEYPTAGLPSSCESIMFNNMVVQAVVNNKPIPEAPHHEQDNLIGLLEKFYLLGLQRSEKEISTYFLLQKAQDLIHFNLDSAFVRRFFFKIECGAKQNYWHRITGTQSVLIHNSYYVLPLLLFVECLFLLSH